MPQTGTTPADWPGLIAMLTRDPAVVARLFMADFREAMAHAPGDPLFGPPFMAAAGSVALGLALGQEAVMARILKDMLPLALAVQAAPGPGLAAQTLGALAVHDLAAAAGLPVDGLDSAVLLGRLEHRDRFGPGGRRRAAAAMAAHGRLDAARAVLEAPEEETPAEIVADIVAFLAALPGAEAEWEALLAAFPARFAADQFDWPELYWLTLALCRPETAAMARLRQAIAARAGARP